MDIPDRLSLHRELEAFRTPADAVGLLDPGATVECEDSDTMAIFWVRGPSNIQYPQGDSESEAWEMAIDFLFNLFGKEDE